MAIIDEGKQRNREKEREVKNKLEVMNEVNCRVQLTLAIYALLILARI